MNDNKYLDPPGSACDNIDHPSGRNDAIEVALMREHRFAFYYWYKWWKKTNRELSDYKAPPLISIDWHRDLCQPCDSEKFDMDELSLQSYKEIAQFCWYKLNPLNDGHILSAAYLNIIGDIFVLCKQNEEEIEPPFTDKWGSVHNVKCYRTPRDLFNDLKKINNYNIYFDIDLDYFTESKDPCGGGDVKLMTEIEIMSILNPNSDLMKWLFERMDGMTIATEPEFCGGLTNSNKIYNCIDKILFNSSLFSKKSNWHHL